MAKNGKPEVNQSGLDPEHELPEGESSEDEIVYIDPHTGRRTVETVSAESDLSGLGAEKAEAPPQPAPAGPEVEKLKAERDELFDKLARLQAEFDNFRKRQAREQQEFRHFALADVMQQLLPVLDSFERALNTREAGPDDLRAGVELMHRQLQDTLGKLGLQAVEAQGKPFDPHHHEAVEVVETSEAEDNTVLEELQRGYRIRDRLLRPAMVRVARNPGH